MPSLSTNQRSVILPFIDKNVITYSRNVSAGNRNLLFFHEGNIMSTSAYIKMRWFIIEHKDSYFIQKEVSFKLFKVHCKNFGITRNVLIVHFEGKICCSVSFDISWRSDDLIVWITINSEDCAKFLHVIRQQLNCCFVLSWLVSFWTNSAQRQLIPRVS